jgi:hypothetical protein
MLSIECGGRSKQKSDDSIGGCILKEAVCAQGFVRTTCWLCRKTRFVLGGQKVLKW